jgi:hypothetical protein
MTRPAGRTLGLSLKARVSCPNFSLYPMGGRVKPSICGWAWGGGSGEEFSSPGGSILRQAQDADRPSILSSSKNAGLKESRKTELSRERGAP